MNRVREDAANHAKTNEVAPGYGPNHSYAGTDHLPSVKVVFVSIVPYQYVMTVPAFQAGINRVHQEYNGIIQMRHVVIYRNSIYSCDVLADYSTDFAAKYFYTESHTDEVQIFIAPCQ
ncbi:hypothetical protein RvY_10949 [Ramazzottius varieornatus]|uniref:Hexosyltransferase n=1 Tax=Ramazzottius varieornatus TaxID=947166 RepID=A0A1D1VEG7_RAMVA|nr:hypothetical protein RvY_10949 [Ramazzottius varieornatus]